MVFTLKGKLVRGGDGSAEPLADLVQALADMGFEERAASDAVRSILGEEDLPAEAGTRESEVLRRAIVRLS
jgi:Holliday junction resolvasome RuvABC DNA-binding subunit